MRPDIAFGADLIAGFPTETDAVFENTLKLVDEGGLAFLHVFPFSPRTGTPGRAHAPVTAAWSRLGRQTLRAAAIAALARHLRRQVGRAVHGLVEQRGPGPGGGFHRDRL